jgi:hypothetical protein
MENTKKILIDFFNNFKEIGMDYNDFYSITFTSYDIKLQGQFSTELARKLSNVGFVFTFNHHLNGKFPADAGADLLIINVTLT